MSTLRGAGTPTRALGGEILHGSAAVECYLGVQLTTTLLAVATSAAVNTARIMLAPTFLDLRS